MSHIDQQGTNKVPSVIGALIAVVGVAVILPGVFTSRGVHMPIFFLGLGACLLGAWIIWRTNR